MATFSCSLRVHGKIISNVLDNQPASSTSEGRDRGASGAREGRRDRGPKMELERPFSQLGTREEG